MSRRRGAGVGGGSNGWDMGADVIVAFLQSWRETRCVNS